jgi:hypothetical protein
MISLSTIKSASISTRTSAGANQGVHGNLPLCAGVEATMSELDRLTGVSKSSGSGDLGAVRFCAIMKAAGLNLLRAARVRRARAKALAAQKACFGVIFRAYRVFKERVQAGVENFGLIFPDQPPAAPRAFKLAA